MFSPMRHLTQKLYLVLDEAFQKDMISEAGLNFAS